MTFTDKITILRVIFAGFLSCRDLKISDEIDALCRADYLENSFKYLKKDGDAVDCTDVKNRTIYRLLIEMWIQVAI